MRRRFLKPVKIGLAIFFLSVAARPALASMTLPFSKADGEKLYKKEKYPEALQAFTDQQVKEANARKDPELQYNIGNTQFRLGHYDEAAKAFADVAASPNPKLSEQAVYNLGNVAYKQGKLEEAAGFYHHALELDPNDEDAKFNLEFVREEIKRRLNEAKDQKKPESNPQDKQDQKDQEKKQDSGSQDKQAQDQQKQQEEQKSQDQAKKNSEAQKQAQQGQKPAEQNQPGGQEPKDLRQEGSDQEQAAQAPQGDQAKAQVSPAEIENAERILQNLDEDRRKYQKQGKLLRGREIPDGKDW